MAMPTEEKGLEYYPMKIDYYRDPKILDLCLKFGDEAEVIYMHTINIVYHHNYYIKNSVDGFAKELYLSFNKRNIPIEHLKDVILFMAEIELLDKGMLEKGIITSKGIQRQFYASTLRRKEREHQYWILTEEEQASVDVRLLGKPKNELSDGFVDMMSTDDDMLSTSVNKNEQSKSKRKSKRQIDKNDKYDKGNYPGYLHYCTSCLIEDEFLTIYDSDIPKFNELFDAIYTQYGRDFDLFHRCFTYCRDYVNRNKDHIDDKFNYFKVAFSNSMSQMEGYDERMQHWRETVDEILRGIR